MANAVSHSVRDEQVDEWTVVALRYHHLPFQTLHNRIAKIALSQTSRAPDPDHRRILDYGTGLGQPARTIAASPLLTDAHYEVFAVDSCKKMLELAKLNAANDKLIGELSFHEVPKNPSGAELVEIIGSSPVHIVVSSFTLSYFSPEQRVAWLRSLMSVAAKQHQSSSTDSKTNVVVVNWGPKQSVPWLSALKRICVWTAGGENDESRGPLRMPLTFHSDESENVESPAEDSFALAYRAGTEGYVTSAGDAFTLKEWREEYVDVTFEDGADQIFRFIEGTEMLKNGSREDHVHNLLRLLQTIDKEEKEVGKRGFLGANDSVGPSQSITFPTAITVAVIEIDAS